MIPKLFDQIEKRDIDALIQNKQQEGKTIEYKGELPGRSDSDIKEFLADVSSFANASGGDIVYGIKGAVGSDGKKTGAPEKVQPLIGTTVDEAKLRLEQIIRNGIAPRPSPYVQIKGIDGWGDDDGQGFVILVRIPRSFASPHMVIFKGSSRFYSRHSSGKYQLDVQELRTAFLATESQEERIKRFREDRLGKIVADDIPIVLSSSLRLVLHLIPIASFLNNERIDLSNEHELQMWFGPINVSAYNHRRNLDGILTYASSGQQTKASSYCQLFSNGTVEAVVTHDRFGGGTKDGHNVISSGYEKVVVGAVKAYLQAYKKMGIIPPVVIAMSLLGCKGSVLYLPTWAETSNPIDRDTLILGDVTIDTLDVDVPQEMKPIFDDIWHACGCPCSSNYDANGRWKLR